MQCQTAEHENVGAKLWEIFALTHIDTKAHFASRLPTFSTASLISLEDPTNTPSLQYQTPSSKKILAKICSVIVKKAVANNKSPNGPHCRTPDEL